MTPASVYGSDTYAREFKEVDRAVLDGEEEGFVKFHVRRDHEILEQPSLRAMPGDD